MTEHTVCVCVCVCVCVLASVFCSCRVGVVCVCVGVCQVGFRVSRESTRLHSSDTLSLHEAMSVWCVCVCVCVCVCWLVFSVVAELEWCVCVCGCVRWGSGYLERAHVCTRATLSRSTRLCRSGVCVCVCVCVCVG